ncbi:epimerase [Pararhodobacter sp. SW119]|uniref:epimerase n=1 Tax=Pararhodobacter sp. SW119 TaxID=2780075 RepID=UPI001AE01713|nr:epimerase [Pararhodobacter sp. SW119]
MDRTVMILGASGGFGSAAAAAFTAAGWQVARYRRGSDMKAAATGARLIVNAMNPPNYHDWARQVPAITAAVMAAARASGARVMIPGNVYVFGAQPGPWSEGTPHRPVSRKGQIRAEMEARWRDSGLPVTLLRAGDFVNPARRGLILDRVVLKNLAQGRITALGDPDAVRAHAYLPDLARAAVTLAGNPDLPTFADVPFPGHAFSVNELAAEIARQTGRQPTVRRFPWWTLKLASPVWELARELREMRYLFDLPHRLDGGQLARYAPGLRQTPFAEIVAGHLPAPMQRAA